MNKTTRDIETSGVKATLRERPIIMSGDNPKLILEGRKTQTRRIITKPEFDLFKGKTETVEPIFRVKLGDHRSDGYRCLTANDFAFCYCPYGIAGDRLWVREKCWIDREPIPQLGHRRVFFDDSRLVIHENGVRGESPHPPLAFVGNWPQKSIKRTPSIHMPRWASRITLEIMKVRVERLQDITADDCIAEGVFESKMQEMLDSGDSECFATAISCYRNLWDSLHGKGAWDKNPWVWVIEFDPSPKRERKTNV